MNFKKLPKVELHCHLDGSVPMSFMKEETGRSLVDLENDIQVRDEQCGNLTDYLSKFTLPVQTLSSERTIRKASCAFVESLQTDNVIYEEVRFSPAILASAELSEEKIIESVIEGLKDGEKKYDIKCGILICAMRHLPEEVNRNTFHIARNYLGAGVCGVDLAGDESHFPMEGFKELFREAVCLGFPVTIHAGETGNAQNIRDAVECGASRIGHGIAAIKDRDVLNLLTDKRIGIEMCPVSNLQTHAVDRIDDYPFRKFLENGMMVTVNTDNRTVSNTTLEKEILLLEKAYSLTDEELIRIQLNAAECSFADDAVKQQIIRKIRSF